MSATREPWRRSADDATPVADDLALTLTQRRVLAALDDRGRVSSGQADFARATGSIFLRACPGSGKTRSVGLRLAYLAAFHPGASVAAVTHTNTAVGAMRQAAGALVTLPDHYYIDTLHSFLLRYVVRPFGHLYMRCTRPPEVVADERDWSSERVPTSYVEEWTRLRIKPWSFDADAQRQLSYRVPTTWPRALTSTLIVEHLGTWAKAAKQNYWARGLLSYSDVLYVAMRVLELFEDVRRAVAARFDELIVDEVQDTNDVQLKCIRLLRGVDRRPNLVFVGDLDQSLYEWARAFPQDVLLAASREGLADRRLTDNYRSSQLICNLTHRFSSRATPDRALGPHRAVPVQPEFWAEDASPAAARFRERVAELGISQHDCAVLARINPLVDRLNGSSARSPCNWLLTVLGRAAAARDQGRIDSVVLESVCRVVATITHGSGRYRALAADERLEVEQAAAHLLAALPSVGGTLATYNRLVRDCVDQATRALLLDGRTCARNVRSLLRSSARLETHNAVDVFKPPTTRVARTVHDAKGASIHAVLVVARPEDLDAWLSEVHESPRPAVMSDETRVAYVAFSRAERLLVLAAPRPSHRHVEALRNVGFRH